MTSARAVPDGDGDGDGDDAFDAVLFDLDGTLIDSRRAIERAWTTWAVEFGVTAEQFGNHHGMPTTDVARLLVTDDRQRRAVARIHALELDDVHDVVALPGATRALAELALARRAIATSCVPRLAQARIAAAGLTPPAVLVTVDDVARGKPAPDPYLVAARRLGVDPTRCLVVEDAPAGLASARAAGCATLAVVTTTAVGDLDADLVVPDLSHVDFDVSGAGRIRVRRRSPDAPSPSG